MDEISEQFNLNSDEAEFYGTILIKGRALSNSLAAYLDKKLNNVEKMISSLLEKKLIKQASGIVPRYIPLPPFPGSIQYLGGYCLKIDNVN